MKLVALGALGLGLIAGCAAAPASESSTSAAAVESSEAPFTWPVPAGWRAETIPFPLGFAPSIAHQGTEELRFGPRFFDPTSPTYFTYAFAFVLSDAAPVTAESLSSDLRAYFTGLASAVTGAPTDPSLHAATIFADAGDTMQGTVRTIDAFGDRRALTLHLTATRIACGDRQVVLAGLSPSRDAAVLTKLDEVRASFVCAR